MLALFAFQCYNLKACSSCRCSSMAEHQLPKLNTRVRFPSPAPACLAMKPNRVSGCSAVGSALGSGPRGRVFKSPHSDHPHGIYGFHGDPFTLDILGRSESALRELGSAEIHGGLPPTPHGIYGFHGSVSKKCFLLRICTIQSLPCVKGGGSGEAADGGIVG